MIDHWDDCWKVHQECAHKKSENIDFLIMLRRQKMTFTDMSALTNRSIDAIGKRLRRWMDRAEYDRLSYEINPRNGGNHKPYPDSDKLRQAFRMREELNSIQDICNKLGFDLARLVFTMKLHFGEERYAELSEDYKDRYRLERREHRKKDPIKFKDTFCTAYCKSWAPEFEEVE